MTRHFSSLVLGTLALIGTAFARYGTPLPDGALAKPAGQFGLPFAGAPGPDTWLQPSII